MSARREMWLAVAAVVVGALVVLLSAGQPRVTSGIEGDSISGGTTPAGAALGLVALAGAGALLLVRGWARAVIGALLLAAGVGIVVGFLVEPEDTGFGVTGAVAGTVAFSRSVWAWTGASGGVVVAGAGLWVAWRGRGWPAPGRRYDAAPSPVADRPKDAWDALDRGEDPTA